jgi:hypothetical protein
MSILVTRSSMPELDEFVEEIKPIFESHWLTWDPFTSGSSIS